MAEFGIDITADDIVDTLEFFDSWEDRYQYIIDLGKDLPPLSDQYKVEETLVRGCQSQVWLVHRTNDGKLYFQADSDAHIVKGLLGVVLAAYNGKSPAEVQSFDIDGYFDRLNLIKHLSPTRGNGLKAMVGRIQATASNAV